MESHPQTPRMPATTSTRNVARDQREKDTAVTSARAERAKRRAGFIDQRTIYKMIKSSTNQQDQKLDPPQEEREEEIKEEITAEQPMEINEEITAEQPVEHNDEITAEHQEELREEQPAEHPITHTLLNLAEHTAFELLVRIVTLIERIKIKTGIIKSIGVDTLLQESPDTHRTLFQALPFLVTSSDLDEIHNMQFLAKAAANKCNAQLLRIIEAIRFNPPTNLYLYVIHGGHNEKTLAKIREMPPDQVEIHGTVKFYTFD